MSRSYFLRYFALGFGCCVAMLAAAVVAAFTVMRTEGDALKLKQGDVTPTPLQMKQALEYMAGNRPPQTSLAAAGGSSGAGAGAGAGAQATATPGTPEAPRGGGSTPF